MSTLGAKRVPPGWPVRHIVLDAVARENGDAAVIHMDRTHGDRAIRQNGTVAFVVGNFQMVGNHVKLLSRRLEHRPAKPTHFGRPPASQITAAARDQRRLLQVSLISQRPASAVSSAGSASLEMGEKPVVGRWKIGASSFL
jgi:hypothetical protein